MTIFQPIPEAPKDPIIGVTELFNADQNPAKVNLSVGVYQNAQGKADKLLSVIKAEERIFARDKSATYIPIDGLKDFNLSTQKLVFGAENPLIAQGRIATCQAPGGTGGVKVGADFLKVFFPKSDVWISAPTWDNHRSIFEMNGFKVNDYPYYNATTHGLAEDSFFDSISKLPARSILLLHACCHNPSGVDLTASQWQRVVEIVKTRDLIPFLDFAYQGFGTGIEEDAYAVRLFADAGVPLFVANSYSKSFALYNSRIGALSIVTGSADETRSVVSQLKKVIRANYSNPPAHGAKVVHEVLSTPELRMEWEAELAGMRERIKTMRQRFISILGEMGVKRDFSFVTEQKGMFSFSGLPREVVMWVREHRHVYMLESGRICLAALNEKNLEYVCGAIRDGLVEVG